MIQLSVSLAVRMEGAALDLMNARVLLNGWDQHVENVQQKNVKNIYLVINNVLLQQYVNMNVKMEEAVLILMNAIALLDGVVAIVQKV